MKIEKPLSIEKQTFEFFDQTTFFTVLLLSTFGLVSIYSATYNSGMSNFFIKQLIFTIAGIAAALGIIFIPKRILKTYSFLAYGSALMLLGLVLVPSIGTEVFGTRGWISLGFISIQPAEIAKVGLVLVCGQFLSSRGVDVSSIRDMAITLVLCIIPVALILMQPDTGSASVIIALLLAILYWAGFNSLILFFVVTTPFVIILALKGNMFFYIGFGLFTALAFIIRRNVIYTAVVAGLYFAIGYFGPYVYNNVLLPHQQQRIDSFLNPGSDPLGSGYNVIQSVMAVGSGGLSGKGFLEGTQTQLRFIPMQWTDFIYSVPTEEFGFIGGAVVIILYFVLIYHTVSLAFEIDSKFYSIVCIGAAAVFFYHVLINIGMVIGMMPVMGIPLPFMSYGGTSMLINMILAGLVMNAYRNHKLKLA